MASKEKVMITIDGQVRKEAKKIAGLIPFSRFVESLLRKEIARNARKELHE